MQIENSTDTIQLIAIKDPFNSSSRVIKTVPYEGKSVQNYVEDLYPEVFEGFEVVASVDGRIIDPVLTIPNVGSYVVFCLSPGDESVLRMAAMLVVAVVSIYISQGTLGPYWAAAFAVAGSFAVNALIPVTPEDMDLTDQGSSYGWSSVNKIDEGFTCPVIYGTTKVLPYLIGKYVGNIHDSEKQRANLLYLIADHEIDAVETIQLNGNDYEGYDDVFIDHSLGFGETFSAERITNAVDRNFTGGSSNWEQISVDTFNDNDDLSIGESTTPYGYCRLSGSYYSMTSGSYYCLQYDASNLVGWWGFAIGDILWRGNYKFVGSVVAGTNRKNYFTAPGDIGYIFIVCSDVLPASVNLDNFSLKEIPEGNTAFTGFRDTHIQQGKNIKLAVDWRETEVPGNNNTGIAVGIGHPMGLAAYYDNGMESLGASRIVQYRLQNESDTGWTTLISNTIKRKTSRAIRFHYQVVGLFPGAYKIQFKTSNESDEKHARDQYIDYVDGIIEDDFRYPGTSIMSVNALATDQLSGGLPTVSCVVSRNTVSVWTGSGWEDKPAYNPAWACYDMLVNDIYGGGVPYASMIYADFLTWADFCTTNSYECHIVLDVTTSFPEALAKVSILGRGHVIQRGTNFGVIIDKEDDPVQLFGLGNIVQGTFTQSYLGKQGRANAIAVTYFDASKDYERLTFELRSSDFDTAAEIDPEKLELTLHGATSKDLAAKHAKFLLNCNEYLIRFVEFEVDVDSLASNVGDVIYVSHDIPQWGWSGHVVSATSTPDTITFDQEVTQEDGGTYHVIVRHSSNDDLEEQPLSNPGGGFTSAIHTLSGTWTKVPSKDDVYAFGEINKVAKQFRITSISRSHQMRRRINALEYRSEVYSDTATIPDYESETALRPHVTGLKAVANFKLMGGVRVAFVTLTWGGLGVVDLYMKEVVEDRWDWVSSHSGNNWAEIYNLEPTKTYFFAVQPPGKPEDGEVVEITFRGWTASRAIYGVSGLQIAGQGNDTVWRNRDLKLAWNLITDSFPSEADGDPAGAGTFDTA